MNSSAVARDIVRMEGSLASSRSDTLAVEEPLEIRVAWHDREQTLAITMRTPGHDLELAVGFLWSEGVIRQRSDLVSQRHCGPAVRRDGTSNIVRISLSPSAPLDRTRLERHFYTSSSCGVCGKTSLEAVRTAPHEPLAPGEPIVAAGVIHALPDALRRGQEVFDRTGGLHAAGLFDLTGSLLVAREDVGRHNAVDKVVGARLLATATDDAYVSASLLMVSGRASFELVQKAVMAQIPILAAVGAPSSLAIELALAEGLTVLGFVRDGRFNIYSGAVRIRETHA
jgi:FdhD protein